MHIEKKVTQKLLILTLILFILVMGFAGASEYKTQQLNTDYNLIFTENTALTCNLDRIQYADNTVSPFMNLPLTKDSQTFTILIKSGNFTKLGETCIYYSCNSGSSNVCVNVRTTLEEITLNQTFTYLFFLLIILAIMAGSLKITIKNPYKQDINEKEKYKIRSESKLQYYLILIKEKFWIVGTWGIYISLLIFVIILNMLVYNLGMLEVNKFLINLSQILLWSIIPFLIFWFIYLIFYFYQATIITLKQQFGGFRT